MDLSRREVLEAALVTAVTVGGRAKKRVDGPRAEQRRALPTSRPPTPLQLRPPALQHPTVIDLRRASNDGGLVHDLSLYGENRDWIIQLPTDQPLQSEVIIDGRGEARNVVVIGGAIYPAQTSDLRTTTLLNGGGYSVYALRGFSGADGGTFRVQTAQKGLFTQPIPWDASPGYIRTAIENVLGSGSVQVVAGPDTPGGPWQFVPSDSRLGRVNIDTSDLEGTVHPIDGENYYAPASAGLCLKDIQGTVHLEGLSIGGSHCCDGILVQTPFATSNVQVSSCHVDVPFFYYNNDWQHPDAMQCYLGPASLQIERTDLITAGKCAILGQPRITATPEPLQELRDWWFKDVLFQATLNPDNAAITPGTSCYVEDDWPALNDNEANWHWLMDNCYASRMDLHGRQVDTPIYLSYWNHYPHRPPPGLHLGSVPRSGTFAAPGRNLSGPGYRSPGYTLEGVPLGAPRLYGNDLAS